jgi:hypothetical protein
MKRRQFLATSSCLAAIASLRPMSLAYAGDLIRLRNKQGASLLSKALSQPNFWAGASVDEYKGELYDEIRLLPQSKGYFNMITGEGREDFSVEQVASTVFKHQDKLPRHMAGAKATPYVQRGHCEIVGADFVDMYFLGDFDFFYGEYFQRMYRIELPDGRIACAFERLFENQVGPATWQKLNAVREKTLANVDLRWGVFNSVVPLTEAFGMYLAEPGTKHNTRVTLIAKLRFGSESGFIAKMGSELPFVLKAGMQSGFEASVEICRYIKNGKYRL